MEIVPEEAEAVRLICGGYLPQWRGSRDGDLKKVAARYRGLSGYSGRYFLCVEKSGRSEWKSAKD